MMSASPPASRMVRRRCWVRALVLVAIVGAGASRAPAAATTVRVVVPPYLSNAPLFIAEEEGYFAAEGLRLDLAPMMRGPVAIPALISGDLEVLAGVVNVSVLNAVGRGANLRLVANKGYVAADASCASTALLTRRGLLDSSAERGPGALRGRRLVMPNRASFEGYVVDRFLAAAGLSIDAVETVDIPGPAELDAFRTGAIDATVSGEPWLTRILTSGHATVWKRAQELVPDFDYAFILFGTYLLKQDPDAGRRFATAYLRGVRQYGQGKTERNLDILAKHTQLDRELLRQLCWPAVRRDGRVDAKSVLEFQAWAIDRKFVDRSVPANQLLDPSFVEHANRTLSARGEP
jgi:NitT/TauT family transport system substrate-binding protein